MTALILVIILIVLFTIDSTRRLGYGTTHAEKVCIALSGICLFFLLMHQLSLVKVI